MGYSLSTSAALGTLKIIADYTSADFDSLGITQEHFLVVFENTPWRVDHRMIVTRTLDALLFGTTDIMALPRIAIPAEYVAAVITAFVGPCNRRAVCIWMAEQRATGARAMDLAAMGVESSQADPVSASQLFGLVVALSDTEESSFARQAFAQRIGQRALDALKLEKSPNA